MKLIKAVLYLLAAWVGLISAGMEFTYMGEHWVGWMAVDLGWCMLFIWLFIDEVKP